MSTKNVSLTSVYAMKNGLSEKLEKLREDGNTLLGKDFKNGKVKMQINVRFLDAQLRDSVKELKEKELQKARDARQKELAAAKAKREAEAKAKAKAKANTERAKGVKK